MGNGADCNRHPGPGLHRVYVPGDENPVCANGRIQPADDRAAAICVLAPDQYTIEAVHAAVIADFCGTSAVALRTLDRRTIRRIQLGEPMGGTNGRTEVSGVAREPLGGTDLRSPALVDVPDQRPQSTGGILPGSGTWRKRPLGGVVNTAFLVGLHGIGDYRDWPGADGTVSKTLGAARTPGLSAGGYLPVADRGI